MVPSMLEIGAFTILASMGNSIRSGNSCLLSKKERPVWILRKVLAFELSNRRDGFRDVKDKENK